ncbi:MAG: DegV family EDD domain-containing protein [Clostridia bacterium]|nr:DegV family EDD domain-containing protein [Clostridia bacterium]
MADFKLLIETGTDLSRKYIMQEENLAVMPLDLIVDGKEYRQDPAHPELLNSVFYDQQRSGKKSEITALHSHRIEAYMLPILEAGKDILYLGLADRMGGNLEAAKQAREALLSRFPERKIGIVDTGCVSLGQGLLVHLCNEYVKAGHTLEETQNFAVEKAKGVHHLFVVAHPKYLSRSKIIDPVTGMVERLLGINPVYEISGGGEMIVRKKPRGKDKAFAGMAKQTAEQWKDGKVYIAHADALADAGKLKGMLKKQNAALQIEIGDIGPAIGVRCGAGTVAVFYEGEKRECKES